VIIVEPSVETLSCALCKFTHSYPHVQDYNKRITHQGIATYRLDLIVKALALINYAFNKGTILLKKLIIIKKIFYM